MKYLSDYPLTYLTSARSAHGSTRPMNLLIASDRFERPVLEVYRATNPFFPILLATVLVITHWPALSLAPIGESGG